MAYTQVTVTGYNSSPPSDDGSVSASNQVLWATIKTKLGDPLKTALETIDDNVAAAFTAESAAWAAADSALQSTLQTNIDAKLASSSYTAADVLSKLLTVDGSGSGVDADLLDGNSSAAFAKVANNLSDLANASTAFGNIKQAATTSATGVAELATAAEMVTGSDTGRVPSVSVVKNHEGVIKAWATVDTDGTVLDGYGVTSVSHDSAGDWTVTLSVTMANALYAAFVTVEDNSSNLIGTTHTKTTTTFGVHIETAAGTDADRVFQVFVAGTLA